AGRKGRNRGGPNAERFYLATHAGFAGVRHHLWPARENCGNFGRRLAFPSPSRRPASVSGEPPTRICRAAQRASRDYDQAGHLKRLVGVNIDVPERKQVEQALADRNMQLELAPKHALVGRFATEIDLARKDFKSQRAQVSPGFAAIYGLPEE